jgi:hypothetical protein
MQRPAFQQGIIDQFIADLFAVGVGQRCVKNTCLLVALAEQHGLFVPDQFHVGHVWVHIALHRWPDGLRLGPAGTQQRCAEKQFSYPHKSIPWQ